MSARLTALAKPDGGVRRIATGSSVRRLVERTLAKQFTKVFEAECAPSQYALSTRSGTDCVGHMVSAATDRDSKLTLLGVDGIGAYDHIFRSSVLGRLKYMPTASAIVPFVRHSYAEPSRYSWVDEEGHRRTVTQAEGGEQGDPLMPHLFSIGIQQALEQVAAAMLPGEQLSAFLDDVYMLCQPDRVGPLYKLLEEALLRNAGIQPHQGKTKTWNRAGVIPEDIHEVGGDAWHPEGINVLGTPIGSGHFITRKMEERIAKERDLWRAIPAVPDLQCSWQLLLQSANPRANHTMRTLPPSQSLAYCQAHDEGMLETAKALGEIPTESEDDARKLSTLPMRMAGLGLRSAERCAPAAVWASWGDALTMIAKRNPEVASEVAQKLSQEELLKGACLSSTQLPAHWTGKAFIGGQAGLICTTARNHQSAAFGTRASGHTAGSVGLLPSETLVSGSCPCLLAVVPLVRPISGPTQDTTQDVRCLTLQPCPSSQFLRTCSRCCCASGWDCPCS